MYVQMFEEMWRGELWKYVLAYALVLVQGMTTLPEYAEELARRASLPVSIVSNGLVLRLKV